MSKTFLEINNIKIYAVLSDLAKCRDSCLTSSPQVPKIEWIQPTFRLLFINGFP